MDTRNVALRSQLASRTYELEMAHKTRPPTRANNMRTTIAPTDQPTAQKKAPDSALPPTSSSATTIVPQDVPATGSSEEHHSESNQ